MIAFDNFETVTGADAQSKVNVDDESQQAYKLMMQRKSLEPVLEEFLESEVDTPLDGVFEKHDSISK
jgi:hypothetical protein